MKIFQLGGVAILSAGLCQVNKIKFRYQCLLTMEDMEPLITLLSCAYRIRNSIYLLNNTAMNNIYRNNIIKVTVTTGENSVRGKQQQ